tara:strand:+ start:7920 stop:9221 length:1302 start_codon:yes stop_codon:yes gene_type:complete
MDEKVISLDIQEINLDGPSSSTRKETFSIGSVNNITSGTPSLDGVELLMNDKVKNSQNNSSSSSSKTMQQELDELNELNNISVDVDPPVPDNNFQNNYKEKDSFINKSAVEIGKGTSNLDENVESWDGFKDINNINIETLGEKSIKLTEQELLKEKFEMLRKLEALEEKGANLSKKYSMDNDLDEMKGEYEFVMNEKEKSNSIKFQGKVLTTMITGLEFLNSKFDPFDIKLDGWSEQINENVEDYDEIFAELHEKYKSKAKMAPEIKLLFQLASSGIMIHMTNTMFKSALPGMDDIMRQNPDLMSQFTRAAMGSMEQTQPGLSNFMNDFSGAGGGGGGNMGRLSPRNKQQERPPPPPPPRHPQRSQMREEMKGPETANIDSILANLNKDKSKTINVDNNSAISIDDIESLSGSGKRGGKSRRKSDKNTIALAI